MRSYLQPTLGVDGKKKEPESNVLLASIENMQYAVTVDVLHKVRCFIYFLNINFQFYIEVQTDNKFGTSFSGVLDIWYRAENCNF